MNSYQNYHVTNSVVCYVAICYPVPAISHIYVKIHIICILIFCQGNVFNHYNCFITIHTYHDAEKSIITIAKNFIITVIITYSDYRTVL